MKRLFYIFLLIPVLMACSNEEQMVVKTGEGTLVISDLSRQQVVKSVVTTRNAVDPDLAIEILTSDGNVYRDYQYAAGDEHLPQKFSLIPGTYTLHAFSENQTTWTSDNDGRGSAVYDATQEFTVQADWVTYVNLSVPMTNYGVTYTVPEGFSDWFPTCTFTISGDERLPNVLTTSQTAYFDPANVAGFTFSIHLVNADGIGFDIGPQNYQNPQAGLIYNVNLTFASDDDPTKLMIGISYDDTYEEIIHEITLY